MVMILMLNVTHSSKALLWVSFSLALFLLWAHFLAQWTQMSNLPVPRTNVSRIPKLLFD